jgi:hypothetical protein
MNHDSNVEKYIDDIISNIKSETDLISSKSDKVCAPGKVFEAGSCASVFVLVEMAKAYNHSAQPKDQIKLSPNMETLNPQKYKLYLVYQIKQRVGDKCTTQKCWSQQDFIKYMEEGARNEFKKYTHRPNSPAGKFDWLSTFDINDVMEQYERIYKDFKFFGAVPMDASDIPQYEIGHVDYAKYYKNGITKMGVVFNLDNHDQPGSHWVSYWFDIAKGHIFYFDSFAIKPEPRVRELMRQQTRFLQSIGKNLDEIRVDYNKVQHQRSNFDCGVFSINFIIRMLRGDDFDKLCSNPISDDRMNKCRKVYFDKYIHKDKKNKKNKNKK